MKLIINMYKKIAFAVIPLILLLLQSNIVSAQGVFLINTDYIEQDNIYIYDGDDTGGDITLQFGNTLGEYLKWDDTGGAFRFSDDLDLENNQLLNTRIENLALVPTCDGTVNGKVYHNTTDTFSYVCNGTLWVQIDGGGAPVGTGTNSESWTIDEDGTGGDLELQFGDSLTHYLQWNDIAQAFIINDDLLLNFNELKQFKIENSATALTRNASYTGRAYHNTTDTFTYVCDGIIWKQIDVAGGSSGDLANHEVGNIDLVSTPSTTPVTITDLTYTPAAGTWLVTLSATGQGTNTGQDMEYGLFINGTVINNTERKLDFNSGAQGDTLWSALNSQSIITTNGTDVIDARYWTGAGDFYVEDRNLTFVRLGD